MSLSHTRHPHLLQQENACLLIIDVQERFRQHIENFEQMTKNIVILIKVANSLQIPVILSEQYPEGLGSTIKEISDVLTKHEVFAKRAFSCCQEESFVKHLEKLNRKQILATGIESHVCVNQTVHDLLAAGYQTHIVTDAISSRNKINLKTGIKKMLNAGAIISDTEMATFELLRTSSKEEFKYLQSLFK